jgi:signal transduction histidine kinase
MQIPGFQLRYLALPVMIVVLGLLGTVVATLQFGRATEMRDQERFERLVNQRLEAITDRMQTYIGLLRGGAGLVGVVPQVSRAEWQTYVARTRVQELYPGIQGIGFARWFSPAERAAISAATRAQGHTEFAIRPAHERPDYSAIVYLEPLDRRNEAAIGYDMFTEATRRAAMERARDTGRAAMSGKVELVQEIDSNKQPGFLIYVPVYAGGSVPSTVEERRARLLGWSYSPFRAGDLFSRSFVNQDDELNFSVFDGSVMPAHRLYASAPTTDQARSRDPAMYETSRTLEIAGRVWTVTLASTPVFDRGSNKRWVPYVFAAGLLMTLLLGGAGWAQARATRAADDAREKLHGLNATLERRVEARTAELSRAHRALQEINENLEAMVAARTADLEAANDEIQRYAYIVSHDLRAPLVNIMGFTSELEGLRGEILAAGVRPEDDPAREQALRDFDESLAFIKAATTKMDGLISAILKISREGRRTFSPEPLDMTTVVQNLADAIRHQTDAAGAAIEVAPGLPDLTVDRLAVEQIFGNLLDNAVKYLDPARPGRIEITGQDSNFRVVYRVKDNGRGIADTDHARVFELFRRAGVQDRPGDGIGLAHVRALVRSLGGQIDLTSEPGIGTTFTVILPKVGIKRAA